MNVIRKNVEVGLTEFRFDKEGINFIVKNLTSGRIYACLGDTYMESISVAILSNMSESLLIDENNETATKIVQIYAEEAGEVEIQCLSYSSLLSDILTNLVTIKNGVYGKDIRQAIHDSIQIINTKENTVEKLLSNLIKNSTSSSPSDAEIVQARGGFELLNNRLEVMENSISSSSTNINSNNQRTTTLENVVLENTKEINRNSLIKDYKAIEYIVDDTEENTFILPSNYKKNTLIEVYVDNVEIDTFQISEVNYVNCVILNENVKNVTVSIKCRNFSTQFINLLVDIIQKNASEG